MNVSLLFVFSSLLLLVSWKAVLRNWGMAWLFLPIFCVLSVVVLFCFVFWVFFFFVVVACFVAVPLSI